MNILVFIIAILWAAAWLMMCVENLDIIEEVSGLMRLTAIIIFLIGAPFFLIANALEGLLDLIYPDDKFNKS